MLISKVCVFIQVQLVITASAPSFRKTNNGRRLTKNASLTAVLTWVRAQSGCCGWGERVVSTG